MPDEYIKCVGCGKEFVYTERDQEFYQSKDFIPPKRCRECRIQKRNRYEQQQ